MKTGLSRSTLLIIAVAIVSAALVGIGVYSVVKKVRQNRQAMNEFSAVSEEITKDIRDKVGNEDTVAGSANKAQQIQDAMGKAANRLTGDAAKAFRAGERFMGAMQGKVASYEAAYSRFVSAGGIEPKSLTSDAVIADRIVLLQGFESRNKEFTDFLKEAENTFRLELDKESYPATQKEETARGFREGGNIDTLLAIRGTDAELCVAMLKYLRLLKAEWGKWQLNEAGAILFQSDRAADEFNGYAKQLQDVADRQSELQKKILSARQKPGAPRKQSVVGTP